MKLASGQGHVRPGLRSHGRKLLKGAGTLGSFYPSSSPLGAQESNGSGCLASWAGNPPCRS